MNSHYTYIDMNSVKYINLSPDIVEMSRSFDSTRRFDGMSHKTDDLELFGFVMICKFALVF